MKIRRVEQGGCTEFILEGSVTQDVDFNKSFQPLSDCSTIDCNQVLSINSVGVRGWIEFFNAKRKEGRKFRFRNCTPPLVYQMNMFINFIPLDEVESVQVPYLCEKCETEITKTFTVKELAEVHPEKQQPACPKCGAPALFDDLPDDYFAFLKHHPKK